MSLIQFYEKIPTASEFNALSESVGWGSTDSKMVEEALQASIVCVCVYDQEKIVGFGRLIGDRTMFLYIQDVMVLPDYQGQKLGTQIMERLLANVQELKKRNPEIRTYLGASKGKEKFYEKFGFLTREEADLGPGMVLF